MDRKLLQRLERALVFLLLLAVCYLLPHRMMLDAAEGACSAGFASPVRCLDEEEAPLAAYPMPSYNPSPYAD